MDKNHLNELVEGLIRKLPPPTKPALDLDSIVANREHKRRIQLNNVEVIADGYEIFCYEIQAHFPTIDIVAEYKVSLFDAKQPKRWRQKGLKGGDKLVLYAKRNNEGEQATAQAALSVASAYLQLHGGKEPNLTGEKYHRYPVSVEGKDGYHMKPAMWTAKAASLYPGEVIIVRPKQSVELHTGKIIGYDNSVVDAKSIMQVSTLAAVQYTSLEIIFSPPQDFEENRIKMKVLLNIIKAISGAYDNPK